MIQTQPFQLQQSDQYSDSCTNFYSVQTIHFGKSHLSCVWGTKHPTHNSNALTLVDLID